MENYVFDSNLKLLGNNLAKCHQLIAQALKANNNEPPENNCLQQQRVRRLCNSQSVEQKSGKEATCQSQIKPVLNNLQKHTTNKNAKSLNSNRDKVVKMSVLGPGERNLKKVAIQPSQSKSLHNPKLFSTMKTLNDLKKFNTRTSKPVYKQRCLSTKGLNSKTKPQETWSHVLKEQNKASNKLSGSESDFFNQCDACKHEKVVVPAKSVSCSHLAHSDCSVNTRTNVCDSIKVIDRSVQCSTNRPTIQSNYVDNLNQENTASTFSIFNPIRTLHFLMQELQGKVSNWSDNNIQRILSEMEETLLRLQANSAGPPTSKSTTDNSKHNNVREFESLQQVSKLIGNVKEARSKDADANGNHCKENLQKKLEFSCAKLEKACQQMEKACSDLKKERDHLKSELLHKNKLYDEVLMKETSYLEKINDLKKNLIDMTSKADEHTKSIENLNIVLNQLQEENKVVSALKDLHKKLNSRLRETAQENERLNSELQVLTLEREKFALLLASRDEELAKLKKDFGEVQAFVSDQLINTSLQKGSSDLNCNFSSLSIDINPEKKTSDQEHIDNDTKSSLQFRSSAPSGWHALHSEVTNSTLKNSNKSSKTSMTASNLIDSIRTLLSEMKQESVVNLNQAIPKYQTIESYTVPQLSDTSVSSQKSVHNISQISSISTLTLL